MSRQFNKKTKLKIDSSDEQDQISVQNRYKNLINSSSEEEEPKLQTNLTKKKRKSKDKTSKIWKHFNRINGKDICKICGTEYISFLSTTNPRDHLMSNHPKEFKLLYPDAIDLTQPQIEGFFKHKITQTEQNKLNELIALFIAADSRPYSLVSSPYFREIIKYLSPEATIPSNVSMTNIHIPKIYENMKSKVVKELSEQQHFSISITCDTWTSISNKSFITFTCHYIDKNYTQQSRVLKTKELLSSHTSTIIVQELINVLNEYQIQNNFKIEKEDVRNKMISEKKDVPNYPSIFVTTDRATNNVKAFSTDIYLPHFYCFTHLLHTILQTIPSFNNQEYQKLMDKVRDISKYFRGSPLKNNKLIEIQEKLIQQLQEEEKQAKNNYIQQKTENPSKIKEQVEVEQEETLDKVLKLKLDVPTRWNSQYIMLNRFVLLSQSIQQYFIFNTQDSNLIKGLDFDNVKCLRTFLKPFYLITVALCKREGCCISKLLKLIQQIHAVYLCIGQADKEFIVDLKKKLLEIFHNKLKETIFDRSELNYYLITSFLNPRTKGLEFLDQDEKVLTMSLIENECQKIQSINDKKQFNNTNSESQTKQIKLDIFGLPIEDEKTQGVQIKYEQELKNYIDLKILKQQPTLEWWSQNQFIFPTLSQIARKYINIQITSIKAERVFSKSGHIINNKRASLKSEHANQLIFISFNQKFYDV